MRFATFLGLVVTASAASGAPGQQWCVKDDYRFQGLHVRKEPREDADTVMVVGPGRALVEFTVEDDWMHVGISRAKGRDGYVPKQAVQATDLDGLDCGK